MEFIALLPDMMIENCKDDILLEIKERIAQIEAKDSIEIKGATQLQNVRIRYSRKLSRQQHQPIEKPSSICSLSPPAFRWQVKAKSFANMLKSKTFMDEHAK